MISTLPLLLGLALSPSGSVPLGMALIPEADWAPPFRGDSSRTPLRVKAFFLDRNAVTQSEFLAFVKRDSRFQRTQVKPLFADASYLQNWSGDFSPPPSAFNSPVTFVSWHAAQQYCACQDKRLPTTAEWERAAWALPTGADTVEYRQRILDWYAKPTGETLPVAGSGWVNAFGVQDLFGVIWEWTSDFNAYTFTSLNPRDAQDSALFCGKGATSSGKSADYAAYMRWAFRTSVKPNYAIANLGFRCAKSFSN